MTVFSVEGLEFRVYLSIDLAQVQIMTAFRVQGLGFA